MPPNFDDDEESSVIPIRMRCVETPVRECWRTDIGAPLAMRRKWWRAAGRLSQGIDRLINTRVTSIQRKGGHK